MRKYRLVNDQVKVNLMNEILNLEASYEHPWVITIKPETRTLDQNAALWPLLQTLSEEKQWTVNGQMQYLSPEDWKDLLTAAFRNQANKIAVGLDGGVVILGSRTSTMTKPEFSDFLEFIHATAADLGVDLGG